MDIRPVKTNADHQAALREIEALWGSADGSPAGDRLDVLATLVEAYEAGRWPLDEMDPIEAIEAAMAHDGHTHADRQHPRHRSAAPQRALTLPMIRRISQAWHVPERLLVREYALG